MKNIIRWCCIYQQTNEINKMEFQFSDRNVVDELPTEMLIKIFSYLPSYQNVSLVNKRFYEVVCVMNDRNIYLTLDSKFFVSILFEFVHSFFLYNQTNRTNKKNNFTGKIELF